MALSTMRIAMRPSVLKALRPTFLANHPLVAKQPSTAVVPYKTSAPMATSAHDQMTEFWQKNKQLGRPNSPWIIHFWPLPMITSLAHRTTGMVMGAAMLAIGPAILILPCDVTHYICLLKALELGPLVWFPMKSLVAFPVIYHWFNGIRHMYWDFRAGYELDVQYKTGYTVFGIATFLSLAVGYMTTFM